jgi:hypothetical protein
MPVVEISVGEFVDRWSILKIKSERLSQVSQLNNINAELSQLENEMSKLDSDSKLSVLIEGLLNCNLKIWNAMDALYQIHAPTLEYAELSLEITRLNQERAFLKKSIDLLAGYRFSEEKSYFENQSQLVDPTQTYR